MNANDKTIKNSQDFSPILISGATGGLGSAFAVECASRGWNLYLTDINPQALQQLAVSLSQTYGVRVEVGACDLTDMDSRHILFNAIQKEGTRFWGLINVAGLDFEGPFYEQASHQIQTIIRLNIEGTLDMIHNIVGFRDPAQTFRIINVASLAAYYPMPVKATYAASKRFLLDFSLALRNEMQEMNATVTVLCPAGMPTTASCVESIDSQGLMGQLTTWNTGSVANLTLNAALKGRAVCIPGVINQLLQFFGSLIPTSLLVNLIGWRWKKTRERKQSAAASA